MNRRTFVKNTTLSAFSVAAFGAINWNGKTFEGNTPTTTDILGPFYRPGAPMRSNLIPSGSTGQVLHFSGTIFKHDGKTPLADALIETWQCDEHEHYDNTSDDYTLRGAVKTGKDGTYAFKTIVPSPYKAGNNWRPAHIHLRVSSPDQQDLITQIYFKGDSHLQEDSSSKSPEAINRILTVRKNSKQENTITFDIVMSKEFPLDPSVYKKIEGLYRMNDNSQVEFTKVDDLLFARLNGQINDGFTYKGNNNFEGGGPRPVKVHFELGTDGNVTARVAYTDNAGKEITVEGTRILKY